MRSLASWCYRHRRLVVGLWFLLVLGINGLASTIGSDYNTSFALPNTDSAKALQLLSASAPARSGDVEQVVVAATGSATLTEPDVRSRVEALIGKLQTLPSVGTVTSPYAESAAGQLNGAKTVGFAVVSYDRAADRIPAADAQRLLEAARSFTSAQLDVAVAGRLASSVAPQGLSGVAFGGLAALVILFIVFGSLTAALLPLISALVALASASAAVGLLSHVVTMPDFALQLVFLIGLGVGVDYALFIVTRFRQDLRNGQSVEAAIATSVATSGRAVLFAGIVVCIALLGMLVLGVDVLAGLGVAASVGVFFTIATSLTLVPALLGFFGHRVLGRRERSLLAASAEVAEHGVWWRWSRFISRRPAAPAFIAVAVIAALAIPFFSLRTGSSDAGSDAPGSTTRQAYDLLATGFGVGFNGPLDITAQTNSAADEQALSRLRSAAAAQPNVVAVTPTEVLSTAGATKTSVIHVFPGTSPQDADTAALVERLRRDVIATAEQGTTLRAYVGGRTAGDTDFARVLSSKLPLFIGLVVLLSFLLLTVVFRSFAIPATAALMNLLSVGAALGVLSATYVWGWGGALLGASRAGPVQAVIPVMLFAILFGLSMDYQMFLLSRIQEEFHSTGDTRIAVTRGLAITGRTITAAAVIMILVFGSFILGGATVIKQFGVGLAVAVFIDAFLIRIAVVPAIMFLLGRSNWWLPATLERGLPRLSLEGSNAASASKHAPQHPGQGKCSATNAR